jgi:serine-type D-Ala-D-Ala carboxypeptidase (penicillin-binding protein 5/6)
MAPARAAGVAAYAEPSQPIPTGAAAMPVGELWRIQVSAAGSREAAVATLERALPLLNDFGQIAPSVEGSRAERQEVFRARLVGFADRDSATRACSVLQARSMDCFVVR